MTNKEKVIKGIQCRLELKCNECPYTSDDDVCDDCDSLFRDALELLKEQEAVPVPVIQREVMNMLVWCCGSCGVPITNGDKFCRMCGRRMKWE